MRTLTAGTRINKIRGQRQERRSVKKGQRQGSENNRDRRQGYDYAYRYPGMNKVLQAAGRVIRTASDRGIILLMDYRFLRRENQELFPEDWKTYYPVSEKSWGRVLEEFWEKEESDIEG